jgi:tetrahydromethanopterin S-methyltransferase subunit B
MAADDLMKIRITADFKEAEGAFLKMAKVATAFESDFKRIASGLNKEFNKINGMAELFGNSTNVVKDKMDALKRSMEQLMTLGLQPMNPQVQKLKAQYDALAVSLNNTTQATNKTNAATQNSATTAKKTNQQWTNLALVIQDLPYGFRGIQNNLPALLGGLAGVGGVAYLAFSTIIAGLTFWDEHNRKVAASTKKLNEEQDAVVSSLSNEAVKVNELIVILESENETRDRKKRALKELQGINPDIFKDLKLEGDSVKNLNTYYNAYIENLKNIILLKKYEKDLEALIQADLKTGQPIKVQEQKSLKKTTDLLTTNNAAVKDNINTAKISTLKDQNVIKTINTYNSRQQEKINLLEKIKKISTSIPLGAGDTDKGGKTTGKKEVSDRERALSTIIENEKKAALELYDERDKELRQITSKYREQIDLATKYGKDTIFLEEAWRTELAAVRKKWNEKDAAEEEKDNKERITRGQKNYEESLNAVNEFYKNKLNIATGDKNEQLAILKEEQAYFDILYGFRLIGDQDYVTKSAEITKAKVEKEKAIIKESFDSLMQLGNGIMSALGPSLDMLLNKSANIGEVLKSAFNDLLKQLIKVTLAAAIAVALIAIIFPGKLATAGGAGKLFGGLFGQGMGLGKDLFGSSSTSTPVVPPAKPTANGGIFGGPSFRLVGEYPGAQSNPEIVAPLDKLKGLIGGNNGGTLEARISGNDLLILMNKAQRNNNLSF